MGTLTKNKGILAAVAIFIVGAFLYNFFFKIEATSGTADGLGTPVVGDEFLQIFTELQTTTLDRTVFSSAGYLLLSDFSTAIPEQATGRPNPFDVIGRD